MIDCINQSRLKNVVWTDPGRFIYQLKVRFVFDHHWLHDLQRLVLELLHFVF